MTASAKRASNLSRRILIGAAVLIAVLFLVIPLVYIFAEAFQKGLMPVLQNLSDPEMLHAIGLTAGIALITVPVNLVFGIMLAWCCARFNFPGKQWLLAATDIPFAVSPVVAGLVYLLWYGANGPLAPWLEASEIQILFAWPGMVLVTIFVTCPFVARELIPVMQSRGMYLVAQGSAPTASQGIALLTYTLSGDALQAKQNYAIAEYYVRRIRPTQS